MDDKFSYSVFLPCGKFRKEHAKLVVLVRLVDIHTQNLYDLMAPAWNEFSFKLFWPLASYSYRTFLPCTVRYRFLSFFLKIKIKCYFSLRTIHSHFLFIVLRSFHSGKSPGMPPAERSKDMPQHSSLILHLNAKVIF